MRDILKDAFARGYNGGISIEPHMLVVFHDAASKADGGSELYMEEAHTDKR